MALSVVQTPALISPVYNPLYYTSYEASISLPGYAFTSDVEMTGSRFVTPETPFGQYFSQTMGSFLKAPTNGNNQFWDPSRVVQTFLSHNFSGDTTCVTPSGINTVGFITNVLGYKTNSIVKSSTIKYSYGYVFNGGEDRNDFKTYEQDAFHMYKFLPNYFQESKGSGRFLTEYNTRTVDLNDTGTLACLNGTFSGRTSVNGSSVNTSIDATTDTFDFTTYKNGVVQGRWMMANPYKNTFLLSGVDGLSTAWNRLTIPAYPKNLTSNKPWSFYDNYFSSGNFGMISLYPHNFEVGDTIFVNQDIPFTFSGYNGYHTIINIPSPYIIETNQGWLGGTPAEGGSVINVNAGTDCSLSLIDDTILSYRNVINNGGFAEFLFNTDVSNVRPGAEISTDSTPGPYVLNGGAINGTGIPTCDPSTQFSVLSNVPYNGDDSGSMLIRARMPSATDEFFGDIDSYDIKMTYYSGDSMTYLPFGEGCTYKIKDKCGKHDRIELFWLNKLGAFDSMLFNGKNTKAIEFTKESYTKRLGNFVDSPFIFDTMAYGNQDFEAQNFNGHQNTFLTVSTGWISEMEGDRVIEAMGSNVVYMYKDDVFTPVITTIESVDVKTKKNNKLVYYTISLAMTYNRTSQRR